MFFWHHFYTCKTYLKRYYGLFIYVKIHLILLVPCKFSLTSFVTQIFVVYRVSIWPLYHLTHATMTFIWFEVISTEKEEKEEEKWQKWKLSAKLFFYHFICMPNLANLAETIIISSKWSIFFVSFFP